jgi:hypothetical protein
MDPPSLNTGARQQTIQPETQPMQATLVSTGDQQHYRKPDARTSITTDKASFVVGFWGFRTAGCEHAQCRPVPVSDLACSSGCHYTGSRTPTNQNQRFGDSERWTLGDSERWTLGKFEIQRERTLGDLLPGRQRRLGAGCWRPRRMEAWVAVALASEEDGGLGGGGTGVRGGGGTLERP